MPSRLEWRMLFNALTKFERFVFIVLFLAAWISGIFILLAIDHEFSTPVPDLGGSFHEGIVGTPRFINPLLAVSDADRDVTRIVFAGLLKPDGLGTYIPQLAKGYTVSDDGLVYTFFLRENLTWHDGVELTTNDVVFTIDLAKNPAIRSPKRANWEGVEVTAPDKYTVQFRLRRPYAPFLENATLGILPKHIWEHVSAEEFAFSTFNTRPIGSGPFYIAASEENNSGSIASYTLERFRTYQPQPAFLERITLVFYGSEEEFETALAAGEVTAGSIQSYENTEQNRASIKIELPRIFAVFFNQDDYPSFRDAALREALTLATDREQIVLEAVHGNGIATSLPIPPGTFGHASILEHITYDPGRARKILADAGYIDSNDDGIIEKVSQEESVPITFTVATANSEELVKTAELIRDQWRTIGVRVEIHAYEIGDLETIIRGRNYDALLFGQVLGYDPDPFAFWHASQRADPGLNVALYANTTSDKLLTDARATIDSDQREELYKLFQEEIIKDKPAVFLFSPLYPYLLPKTIAGVNLSHIPLPHERFSMIETWYTKTKSVWNILLP